MLIDLIVTLAYGLAGLLAALVMAALMLLFVIIMRQPVGWVTDRMPPRLREIGGGLFWLSLGIVFCLFMGADIRGTL